MINGAFRLWQRGQTHTLPAPAGTRADTADRRALIQTAPARSHDITREVSGTARTPDSLRLVQPLAQPAAGEVHLVKALEIIAGRGEDEGAALLAASDWSGHQVISSAAFADMDTGFAPYSVSGAVPSDATRIGQRL